LYLAATGAVVYVVGHSQAECEVRRGAFKMRGSGRAFGSKEQGKGKGSQRCLPDSGGRGNTQWFTNTTYG
jgi:hypothetical protein